MQSKKIVHVGFLKIQLNVCTVRKQTIDILWPKKCQKITHVKWPGDFFGSRFTCGSVGPLVCVNAAKCVICGNTNPFGCAKTQVCASMFQPVHSTASVASTFITMMEKKMVLGSIAHILIVVQTDL